MAYSSLGWVDNMGKVSWAGLPLPPAVLAGLTLVFAASLLRAGGSTWVNSQDWYP